MLLLFAGAAAAHLQAKHAAPAGPAVDDLPNPPLFVGKKLVPESREPENQNWSQNWRPFKAPKLNLTREDLQEELKAV